MEKSDLELDLSGLNCPLPVLHAKKALAKMRSGQNLSIISTDSVASKDFKAFSRQTGNEIIESRVEEGKFYFLIRKA